MSYADLNGVFNAMSGKSGNLVFVKTKNGTIMRQRVKPANPRTPAQSAARTRLRLAQSAYSALTPDQRDAWKQYALREGFTARDDSRPARAKANTVFVGLASKYLQINPGGTVPVLPPATPFYGDGLVVEVTDDNDAILFSANVPNTAGVRTELLLQRLASDDRTPQPNAYRSYGFVSFAAGSLTAQVDVPAGYYAPAYRFVRAATGQASPIIPLPVAQAY